jgi:signal transduction histidine kinase
MTATDAGALPSLDARYAVERARTATLIASVGLSCYFAFVAATHQIFLFSVADVAPLFVATIALNLAMAVTAHVWVTWRRAIYLYQAGMVIACTVILHRLGGVMMGALFVSYVFPVIFAEMLDSSVFGIANVCATAYAVMVWVERENLRDVGIGADQQRGFVIFAFAVLNCIALYTNRYGHQIRNLTRHLREKVAERTTELTTLNAELAAKAQALEAKQAEFRDFVYTVTHDLKGPLSSILLTADMLLQRDLSGLDAESRQNVERILRLAGVAEDMIRDLLELFRITSLSEAPEWVELSGLARAAVDALRPQIAAKGARVDVNGLPRVWGQPRKLGRVLANLLDNAVKYVPAGRGRIEIAGEIAAGEVVLSVRDNGIGVPDAYRRAIFDLFRRVPAEEQLVDGKAVAGTGVGLTAVKRIVEAHGGSVSVAGAAGGGSCFTVRLPAGEAQP